jgi:hypothetical protein
LRLTISLAPRLWARRLERLDVDVRARQSLDVIR